MKFPAGNLMRKFYTRNLFLTSPIAFDICVPLRKRNNKIKTLTKFRAFRPPQAVN